MGFLDSQLAQGYSMNYSQRIGLLSHDDAEAINHITNGLQLVDNFLSLLSKEMPERFVRQRAAEPGAYRSSQGQEIGNRISSSFRMSSRSVVRLRFSAMRLRSASDRKRAERRQHRSERMKRSIRERRSWRLARAARRARNLRRLARIARFATRGLGRIGRIGRVARGR